MFAWRTTQAATLRGLLMLAVSGAALVAEAAPSTQPATTAQAAPMTRPAGEPTTQPAEATATRAPATSPAPKAPAPRPEKPQPAEKADILFHFSNEPLQDVVRFMADAAGKPILGDVNAIQGQLTYFDSKPYTYTEAMGIVNQVLRMRGYTIVERPRYFRVVPVKDVPKQPDLPIIPGQFQATRLPGHEIVTAILPLHFMDAEQATAFVARMVNNFGMLSRLPDGKGIIITDTVDNIRRIQRLLTELDKSTSAKQVLKYYTLKTAPASDVASLIQRLFKASSKAGRRYVYNRQRRRYERVAGGPEEQVAVTADARSNLVIVVASPDKHAMVEELIQRVDTEEPVGKGSVRILKLKTAKAADLAKTLSAAVGTKTIIERDSRGRPRARRVSLARIVPDAATNRLIVSAAPDIMKQILDMVAELDGAGAEAAGLRIFPLKVANAASLVGVIQNTLYRRDSRGRAVRTFSIAADPRTNSLVAKGASADLDEIARLLEQLDRKTPTDREIHVVRLKAGDAREVAAAMTRLLSAQPGRPGQPAGDQSIRIEPATSTNSLLIAAAPGDWERIGQLLKQLDQEVDTLAASTRIFPLQHARAVELAPTLQRIFDPRRRQRRAGRGESEPIVVAAEPHSNALIVSASGEDLKQVQQMLQALDVPPPATAKMQWRTYALTNASAAELARSLARLFATRQGGPGRQTSSEPQPRFEAEPNSNQLVVAATAEHFKVIDELVRQMQTAAAGSETVVKFFALKHARARDLAGALQAVVRADLEAARRRGAQRARRSDFQVSVDERTNSLLITAPAGTMAVIEQLLPKLDDAEVQVQTTKVIELVNADPSELAQAVNAALAGKPAPRRREGRGGLDLSSLAGREVLVVPEQSARAVLLTGRSEDVAFAEKLIQTIDARPSATRAVDRTFKLRFGKAEEIAAVLNATVARTRGGRGGVPTRISADPGANALVVSAPGDVVERIQELLSELDVKGAGQAGVVVEIVRLKNASAASLATVLNAAAQPRVSRRQGWPGRRTAPQVQGVRVVAEEASNSLLVSGRKDDVERTKQLIAQLDESVAAGQAVTRLVPLDSADPVEVASAVNAALAGQAQRGRGGLSGQLAGLKGRKVSAVAAASARAVLLTGLAEDVAFAQDLIRQLDQRPSATQATVRTFPLKHAKAEDIARVLNETLGQIRSRRFRPSPRQVPTRISADTGANAVVVSATPEVIAQVQQLLAELDVQGAQGEVTIEIVRLENARAEPLAAALNDAQTVGPSPRGRGRSGSDGVVRVTADAASNSLMLTGRKSRIEQTKALIQQLDTAAAKLVSQTRVFRLTQARAGEVAPVLEQILTSPQRGRRRDGAARAPRSA